MKMMKKLAAFALTLSLALPMYSIVGYAANGRVSFTDPKTKTGETVEVTCALRAGGEGLESFDVTLEYDPEYLAYESGDEGVTKESNGVLKYTGKGSGDSRIGFAIKFVALKVGSTKIEVKESEGVTAGGEAVDCTNGNSTIEIEQGTEEVQLPTTGAEDVPVTVDGASYNLSDNFKNADIPAGFNEVTMNFSGQERRFIQDANGTSTLGYLVDSEGNGEFYLFNPSTETFSAYVMVNVSSSTTIVLQKADEGVKVPEGYQEVKLTVNEHEFPAWQNLDQEGFYLVYAMNTSTGEKSLYQYDVSEESYQRFVAKAGAVAEEKEEKEANKVVKLLKDNLMIVMIAAAALVFILFIIIIVVSIKLRHRNLELDDIYENGLDDLDDLDDDDDYEEEVAPAPVKEKKSIFKKSKVVDDEFEALDDDFDDDDDYYDDDDEFEDDDDDFDFDDDDDDDKYGVDFIDLD